MIVCSRPSLILFDIRRVQIFSLSIDRPILVESVAENISQRDLVDIDCCPLPSTKVFFELIVSYCQPMLINSDYFAIYLRLKFYMGEIGEICVWNQNSLVNRNIWCSVGVWMGKRINMEAADRKSSSTVSLQSNVILKIVWRNCNSSSTNELTVYFLKDLCWSKVNSISAEISKIIHENIIV